MVLAPPAAVLAIVKSAPVLPTAIRVLAITLTVAPLSRSTPAVAAELLPMVRPVFDWKLMAPRLSGVPVPKSMPTAFVVVGLNRAISPALPGFGACCSCPRSDW